MRDTWLLIREFGWPLVFFFVAIIGGGLLYYLLAQAAEEPLDNVIASIYLVLSITLLQSAGQFPNIWYLEIFYFVMPLIGLIILAQGTAEFGVMLFNRRARGKEWEMSVASTMNKHIILVGLGHLGYRVVHSLHEMDQDVVVIEQNPNRDMVANAKALGVPVIQDDASRDAALEAAGIKKAKAIILCTQNDSLNLQVALKARRMRPDISVTVRIFDDEFASSLHEQFGFLALSATGMAAPIFAGAAAGLEMTQPITIEGETLSLGRIKVNPGSSIQNQTVREIEERFNLSIVLLRRKNESDLHPVAELEILVGDSLAVLGGQAEIGLISKANG
jgi:Trk K+ transport system NAD-binding subunit